MRAMALGPRQGSILAILTMLMLIGGLRVAPGCSTPPLTSSIGICEPKYKKAVRQKRGAVQDSHEPFIRKGRSVRLLFYPTSFITHYF
jgi:hypothetical protein